MGTLICGFCTASPTTGAGFQPTVTGLSFATDNTCLWEEQQAAESSEGTIPNVYANCTADRALAADPALVRETALSEAAAYFRTSLQPPTGVRGTSGLSFYRNKLLHQFTQPIDGDSPEEATLESEATAVPSTHVVCVLGYQPVARLGDYCLPCPPGFESAPDTFTKCSRCVSDVQLEPICARLKSTCGVCDA